MLVMSVTDQPKITVHPKSETTTEGNNLTLSCDATGNPVPTISWTKDGSAVDTSNNSRISLSDDNKQLTIMNVKRTDSGKYRCTAKNNIGTDTSNATAVDVQCKNDILLRVYV